MAGEAARAWEVLGFCFGADPGKVKPERGATVFMLAAFPRQAQDNVILWHLLQHFEVDFPNHPRLGEALLLAARVAYVDLHDRKAARACLGRIRAVAPQCVATAEFAEISQQIRV
jgi:hypothetical protein